MEIQKIARLNPITFENNTLKQFLAQLKPGAEVSAVVGDSLPDNTYVLNLQNGLQIKAQSQVILHTGSPITLKVTTAGNTPELTVVLPRQIRDNALNSVQETLKLMLPMQVDADDLVLALKNFPMLGSDKSSPLMNAIQALRESISPVEDLQTAEGLKQAVDQSGVFLENKLARQINPQDDFKAKLLVLADMIRKAEIVQSDTSESRVNQSSVDVNQALLAKTEAAIARIVVDQLAAVPQENEPQALWQFSLPCAQGDHDETVRLKIGRESGRNDDPSLRSWSVVLEMNPPGMGKLRCKISLHDQKVDTYFWGESAEDNQRINCHLEMLGTQLSSAGLTVGNLNVATSATRNTDPFGLNDNPTRGLLDELA